MKRVYKIGEIINLEVAQGGICEECWLYGTSDCKRIPCKGIYQVNGIPEYHFKLIENK